MTFDPPGDRAAATQVPAGPDPAAPTQVPAGPDPAATTGLPGQHEAPARPREPWWRRRAVIVTAVIVAILAVTVITDLPHPTSRADQISDESTVIGEINTDLSPCTFAIGESFSIYHDEVSRTVTASEQSTVPGLLGDDLAACTFTSSSIFDLSNIEVPGSAAGRDIGEMVVTVTDWATSDSVAAIQQIEVLASHLSDHAALSSLGKAEKLLAADRAKAMQELGAADKVLDTHLPQPDLPNLPLPASQH